MKFWFKFQIVMQDNAVEGNLYFLEGALVNILVRDLVCFPRPHPGSRIENLFYSPIFYAYGRLGFDGLINVKYLKWGKKLHSLGKIIEKWGRNITILVIFPKFRVILLGPPEKIELIGLEPLNFRPLPLQNLRGDKNLRE